MTAKQESPNKETVLSGEDGPENDEHVKLLDIALEKGSLKKQDIDREKEKKVRFLRENFQVE